MGASSKPRPLAWSFFVGGGHRQLSHVFLKTNNYSWRALRAGYAMVANVGPSSVRPIRCLSVVMSRKLSKNDPQLLWNTIRTLHR